MTALTTLVQDMDRLEAQLRTFETRHGVKSQDFYPAIIRGDLAEFDELDEYRLDFIEWLALYKTWMSFDEKYRQLVRRQPVAMQIKANLQLAHG